MKCPKCSLEGYIDHSGITVCGDNSPEESTRIFNTLSYICRNERCERYREGIGEERILIYPEETM